LPHNPAQLSILSRLGSVRVPEPMLGRLFKGF
jgi:hypothetical protein